MLKYWASSCCSSVFTLANTMSGCSSETSSKVGPNCMQGPHQEAQKSTITVSFSVTIDSKLSLVNATVAIGFAPVMI